MMATYQEQIEKYRKINEAKKEAEESLDILTNCLIDSLLPLEWKGDLKITPELLVAIVKAVANAASKSKP